MRVENKTAVLTGATGGIGQCIAKTLAANGMRLLLVGRDNEALEQLLEQLPPVSKPHRHFVGDLRDATARKALVEMCISIEVDVLINNAGVSEFKLLEDSNELSIAKLIDLNLTVPIQLSHLLLPYLQSKGEAAVINIGSALGAIGYPAYSVYGASKFGLRGFSEALRRELGDSAVRVMHLAPRATNTASNSANVVAMNTALGTQMDEPGWVAATLLSKIRNDRWENIVLGWPESFYAKINALLPKVTSGAIHKQLKKIKQFAKTESNSSLSKNSQ